ncbi:transglutaminase-like domain-containing protein [Clostridium sp. Marseille-QA1073]
MELKISLDIKKIIPYALIITFLIIKVISALPQHYSGMDLSNYGEFLNNTFAKTSDDREIALNGKFTINSSGYSNSEKKLGGPITLNKQEVFRVKSPKPYYLKGSVKDYYTGSSWSAMERRLIKRDKDYDFEKSYSLKRSIGVGASLGNITITPTKKISTTSFFTPNMGVGIKGDYDEIYCDEIPTFLSKTNVNKPYNVIYYIYKESYGDVTENIENMINGKGYIGDAHEFNYYNLPTRNFTMDDKYYTNDRYSNLDYIIEEIMEKDYLKYMQIPRSVPSQVYDLTHEIIGQDNTVIEKARSIRNYLSENYPYTLKVSNVPMNSDFVNHFLFEEKKGYCTYFASATAIMCRIAGIPARYVEGFKTPNNIDENGEYIVTNGEAHAWCEVLIDPSRDIWAVVDPSPTPTEVENQNTVEEDNKEEQSIGNDNKENEYKGPSKNRSNMNEEEENWQSELSPKNNNIFKYSSLIVTILLYILIRVGSFYKRKNKIIYNKSIIPLYQYYLRRLESIRIIKNKEIGDLEFVNSIKDSNLKDKLNNLVNLSYEEFYGNKTENASIERLEYFNFIEEYIKNKDNRINYIMKKYFGL